MTDWMTIRVVLTGRGDATLPQPPGRVMLAHADHSFADLGEAIDSAFGRWDLTPLHQFEVEGRVLLSAEAAGEDSESEASDEVTVGEVGLRTGARFGYLFDIGEQWSHDCAVESVGVDPYEVAGEEPDVPVPVYGWGTVPDQYGRDTEDDEDGDGETVAAGWRDDGEEVEEDGDFDDEDFEEDYDEDEDFDEEDMEGWAADESSSWAIVRDALASVPRDLDEAALVAAAARLREQAHDSQDWSYEALWAASGLEPGDQPGDDRDLWLSLAAGVIAPAQGVPLEEDVLAAWGALEPADWAGAVIELIREGAGAQVTPATALAAIARCPEVEEDDLTDEGEAVLLQGLGVAVALWGALGVLDATGKLTTLGVWGLPESLRRAWDGDETGPDDA